jgi:hypothetical protein
VGLLLAAEAVRPVPPAVFGATALRAGALAALAAGAGGFSLPLAPVPLLVTLPAALAYLWSLAVADGEEGAGSREQGAGSREQGAEDHAARSTFHVSRFTFHIVRLAWAGLGVALLLGGPALPAPWDILLAAGALIGVMGLGRGPALHDWAVRTQAVGWLALGVALAAALLPG